jgi:hypothetical protein
VAGLIPPAVMRWRTREVESFAENPVCYSFEDAGQDS